MSTSNKREELSRYECKQLLQDVERAPVARAQVSLSSICNDNQEFYGPSGDARRRAFQYKWNNFRRRNIEGYVKTLHYYKVPAGPNTLKEAEEAANYSELSEGDHDDNPSLTNDAAPADTSKEADTAKKHNTVKENDDEEEVFADLMMSSFSSHPETKEEASDTATVSATLSSPPRTSRTTPFISPPRHSGFRSPAMSPVPNMNHLESALSGLSLGSGDAVDFPGSKHNPFLSTIDLLYPERSRDFNPQLIEDLERNGYSWRACHIRKTVPTPDHKLWSAVIPDASTISAEYLGRVILIKGPSRDFYESNHDIYHHKMKCEQTKKAHKSTDAQMKDNKDDERDSTYFLVIFPAGTVLDNSHLGNSGTTTVPKYSNAITFEKKHALNKYNRDIYGTAVYWEIAFKYGGKPLGEGSDDDVNDGSFFD
jgi:hypothetical protein